MRDYFKTTAGVAVACMLGFVLVLVLIGASYGFSWIIAPFKGATEARNQTVGNGSYRIAAYDTFYDQCAGAQTVQQNLANTKQRLKQARADGDQAEVSRQETNLQAQRNDLNSLVNGYNADSHKSYTLAQFKASDLPFTIDAKEPIQCAL